VLLRGLVQHVLSSRCACQNILELDCLQALGIKRYTLGVKDNVSVEIRTEHLLLRPFRHGDVDDALAYRDDREFARYLSHIPQPFTRRDAEEFVARNIEEPWAKSPTFAVVLSNHVIGTVNFEIDLINRIAMLGYAIARAHWGRGLATEAATAAVAWAFAEHRLVQIWASTEIANVRSQRVLEKLGMQRDFGETDKMLYRLIRG
jgi:[ribosomal protein S5]-alanine N-acetyltransferase